MAALRTALLLLTSVAAAGAGPPPSWAYGFKDAAPPAPPPAANGIPAPPPPDDPRLTVPGTDRRFSPAEIRDNFGPADWFPEDHPPMPPIVAHGREPSIWACARCHYPNGKGRPENAPIAGLPVDYFIAQLQAFRRGDRGSADPRKSNTPLMAGFAKAMTDDEIRAAAEYFGALKWTPWIRVVETERVPQTTLSAGMFLPTGTGADEPIGHRLIEVPEDADAVEVVRNPRVGFVAYVPPGTLARGRTLVTTGAGKTVACALCHGPELAGMPVDGAGLTPGLAGRSPSYLTRQLFDIQAGTRHGARVALMRPVVAALTTDDMLAIAAYLASLPP